MSNIKLLRGGASARTPNPGASPSPRPIPTLGPEWWTNGWREATEPLDERCEQILEEIKRAYGRVRDFSDPLGTVFYRVTPGERLPVALWQGILRIPDEFSRGEFVLRKVKDGDRYAVRVCGLGSEIVGIIEPAELLDLDHFLTWCAHWLLATNRISPEMLRSTLKRQLP